MHHIGTKAIQTPRFLLRRITLADAGDMFGNWAGDPEVTRFMPWPPHESLEVSRAIIAKWVEELERDDCYRWCIEYYQNHQVIGTIDVVQLDEGAQTAVIGYCLSRAYWNQGVMTEALKAVIDYLFGQADFRRVEAYHHTENLASGRVMAKSGMQPQGIRPQAGRDRQGQPYDMATYAITKIDWESKRKDCGSRPK